jgi:hypothetical protein
MGIRGLATKPSDLTGYLVEPRLRPARKTYDTKHISNESFTQYSDPLRYLHIEMQCVSNRALERTRSSHPMFNYNLPPIILKGRGLVKWMGIAELRLALMVPMLAMS